MTPKEKAKDLVESMMFLKMSSINWDTGELEPMPMNEYYKQCALKAVDELISSYNAVFDDFISRTEIYVHGSKRMLLYWQDVKAEIEKK
jgi:hypothetical protein